MLACRRTPSLCMIKWRVRSVKIIVGLHFHSLSHYLVHLLLTFHCRPPHPLWLCNYHQITFIPFCILLYVAVVFSSWRREKSVLFVVIGNVSCMWNYHSNKGESCYVVVEVACGPRKWCESLNRAEDVFNKSHFVLPGFSNVLTTAVQMMLRWNNTRSDPQLFISHLPFTQSG